MLSDRSPNHRNRIFSRLRVIAVGALFSAAAVMLANAFEDDASAITPLDPPSEPDYTTRVEGTDLWFIELKSPPAAKGTSITKLNSEKQAFRQAAADAGVVYTERYAFNNSGTASRSKSIRRRCRLLRAFAA